MTNAPVLPGQTIGILGGGQLGRMLSFAAKRMGYRVAILSPERDSPAGQVSDVEIVARYDDSNALEALASQCAVVTLEFENVPSTSVEILERRCPVRPGAKVLHIAQHRLREKQFLRSIDVPIANFSVVRSAADLRSAQKSIGTSCVLKTAGFGYDGKGQALIEHPLTESDAEALSPSSGEFVLEEFIKLDRELSVLVARGLDGACEFFPVAENRHAHHILDLTMMPAPIPESLAKDAQRLAGRVAESIGLIGLLCVEMFLTTDGKLLVNELAPRPHNSGHVTIESCNINQFEQQLRAVCGLPLAQIVSRSPAAMANLLGDVWARGEPDWRHCFSSPNTALHLYGKSEPRPGRKMGHITVCAEGVHAAAEQAQKIRQALT